MSKILETLENGILHSTKFDTKSLVNLIVKAFKDEVQFGKVSEEYLHKYTTKDLLKLLNTSMADKGMKDENKAEVVLNIVNLLYLRFREYQAETGDTNHKANPDLVDSVVLKLSRKRSPKPLPDGKFPIKSWDELCIDIHDGKEKVTFRKVIDDVPSAVQFDMTYTEIGFAQVSVEFLKICATVNNSGAFHYHDRLVKSRVERKIRNLFEMEDEAIISVKHKKGHYYPLFKIRHYDKDGNSVYGNVYGRS